jgi:hypothetical protein
MMELQKDTTCSEETPSSPPQSQPQLSQSPPYNINLPWETLDSWQKEYIFGTPHETDCFLLTGRQVGKTTAMSIKAVELCLHKFQKGEYILICSLTEKQAQHMLAKAQAYAEIKYKDKVVYGVNKPTMHRILFKNGTGIFCFAAGETGEGLRGYTIKKLMIDEGSRMSEEFFVSVMPMLSVTRGSMDIASTPCGKEGFFYNCSKDEKFKKFYISAEDCPRHPKAFLEDQKRIMTKLEYAQEYLAIFTDELKRFISEELIEKCCIQKREERNHKGQYYLGIDVAGWGKDESTFQVFERVGDKIIQRESIAEKRNFTIDTSRRAIELNSRFDEVRKIGVDDGGIGFGVLSELLDNESTKRKTISLNNASRNKDGKDEKKKLLKEEMYLCLLSLMEHGRVFILDDDEVKASLRSIQVEEERIFGSYSHITEGIIRAVWLAEKEKGLNIFAHTF